MDPKFRLPDTVISKTDAIQLFREVESVDDFFAQAKLRKAGSSMSAPRSSQLLEEVAKLNNAKLLEDPDRKLLKQHLKDIAERAPVVHISFAANPNPKFLVEITTWFRKEIDPYVLLQVGLQPSIAAGCVVRTTNKYFDFSLRKFLSGHDDKLIASINGGKS